MTAGDEKLWQNKVGLATQSPEKVFANLEEFLSSYRLDESDLHISIGDNTAASLEATKTFVSELNKTIKSGEHKKEFSDSVAISSRDLSSNNALERTIDLARDAKTALRDLKNTPAKETLNNMLNNTEKPSLLEQLLVFSSDGAESLLLAEALKHPSLDAIAEQAIQTYQENQPESDAPDIRNALAVLPVLMEYSMVGKESYKKTDEAVSAKGFPTAQAANTSVNPEETFVGPIQQDRSI